jgi:hypothetical protein
VGSKDLFNCLLDIRDIVYVIFVHWHIQVRHYYGGERFIRYYNIL